jgi:CO/xanthine dehydrogenase FAD-binding subunit
VRTALSRLRLHAPATLDQALGILRDEREVTPLAGGTDVYVGLNAGNVGTAAAGVFMDIFGLPELGGIRRRPGGGLVVGAGATFAEIASSALVRRSWPILAEAARQVGGAQIQNRATLGGNVANASPAADAVPVLLVAEATLVLVSAGGERRVPAAAFFTSYRRTQLRPDELLVAVELPPAPGPAWFRKVGTRLANAISKIVFAGVRGSAPRVSLGSVAPTTVRLPRTEAALAGGASIAEAQEALRSEIAPIDDLRSTAAYRLDVAARLLAQFWNETDAAGLTPRRTLIVAAPASRPSRRRPKEKSK